MADQDPNSDLESLQKRIDSAKESGGLSHARKNSAEQPQKSALALAFRVGIELVSAVAVGLAIGYGLDAWLDTKPWLMLVFTILGGCAGILNVYRMARGFGYAAGYQTDNETDDKT
ncbi:MAG: AtpZ/AtpI family protein [Rhodospirillaceae bacterium]